MCAKVVLIYVFQRCQSRPIIIKNSISRLNTPNAINLRMSKVSSNALQQTTRGFDSQFRRRRATALKVINLPPVIQFVKVRFTVRYDRSNVKFLAILMVVRMLQMRRRFIFTLHVNEVIIPYPLVVIKPLYRRRIGLRINSFFL